MATHIDPDRSLYATVDDPAKTSSCVKCGLVPGKKFPPLHLCGRCNKVYYCSRMCQKKDWAKHEKVCEAPAKGKEEEGDGHDNGDGTKDMGVQADLE